MDIPAAATGIIAVSMADVLRSLAEVLVDFPYLFWFEFVPAVLEDAGIALVGVAREKVGFGHGSMLWVGSFILRWGRRLVGFNRLKSLGF